MVSTKLKLDKMLERKAKSQQGGKEEGRYKEELTEKNLGMNMICVRTTVELQIFSLACIPLKLLKLSLDYFVSFLFCYC